MQILLMMLFACGGSETTADSEPAAEGEGDGAAAAAEANPDMCQIMGSVMIDSAAHPGSYAWAERKPGSKVVLKKGGQNVAEGETAKEGMFKFGAVPPGDDYEVRASRDGFKPMTQPAVCTAGGTANLKLFLERGKGAKGKRKGKGKGKKKN